MPRGLQEEMAEVGGLRMHYVATGAGPTLVLLHGWPQSSYQWRFLIPRLAESFTVIAPDLRGYGLSDKPPDGYDKRTMAEDVRSLVRRTGSSEVRLVGHDRGARVAHRYALDHPDEVEALAVLDIIPTRAMFRGVNELIAQGYWHWFFHLQPDLPELLVGDRVELYLRYFFERWTYNRPPVEEAIPVYVEAFSRPGALRAGFADYRATVSHDLEHDDESAARGERLTMPVLALWGEKGLTARLPVLEIWRDYADSVEGEGIERCGHFLPEERPKLVGDRLLDFLARPC